ncbi:MAG: sigma-70 family RNA polymerase sigma factor [Propionicimonas sp.]
MARGLALATTVTEREQRTSQLFTHLQSATAPDRRQAIIAELVEVNLPLCDALAGRYVGRGADHDDLLQVARTALLLAVERFDPDDGRVFASFAVPTITGELKRYFRDHCWVVRPPRQIQELRSRVVRARAELEQATGREVTVAEIGRRLEVADAKVRECVGITTSFRPLSLEAPAHPDASTSFGDSLAGGGELITELVERLDLRRALASLPPRDRQVLKWRFEEECTQSEIARRLGVSQMQVSRIIRRLLDRTRALLEPSEPLAS